MSKRWLVATKLYGTTLQKKITLNLLYCLQCSSTACSALAPPLPCDTEHSQSQCCCATVQFSQ